MAKTLKDIQKLIKDQGIAMVDFKLTDIDGRWRHLSIPAERLTESTMEHGIGFDGSNYGYAPIENSDMVFIPVLDSAVIDRYAEIPTLSMIGDVRVIDLPKNRPFDQYPRNVAIRALEYMKEIGVADQMVIGPEYEFYLFDEVSYNTDYYDMFTSIHTSQAAYASGSPDNNNGYQVLPHAGYHNTLPTDIRNDIRSRMCMVMKEWGVDVKYHHPEVGGSGQMEIEVELGDMLKLADDTMSAKYVIKNEAAAEGITATFMPKPLAAEAGSGMHVHMLLFKDGKPVFYDKKGYAQLSKEAHWFMGGLLSHARSLCAITNPSTNSYKRLVPGFEAPVTIGYAMSNRSAVIRIPAYAKTPETKRFELRNPDATCNPYYAYAAILMAGLDGIKKKIDPEKMGWGPYDFNLYTLSEEEKAKLTGLPASLDEAIKELEADHDYLTAGGVFPERLLEQLIARNKAASSKISKLPHPMEFAMYYDL
ncbi:MAG: type I glutamate--ammonia ligase [Lachnospiraceae bacterium]|nr:type I glutamate--ammonia ligase [Lachnospiraceae bacterium]MBO4900102.1 type I glutamate--ammonia ligase [Lachnospiraceae bacterium]